MLSVFTMISLILLLAGFSSCMNIIGMEILEMKDLALLEPPSEAGNLEHGDPCRNSEVTDITDDVCFHSNPFLQCVGGTCRCLMVRLTDTHVEQMVFQDGTCKRLINWPCNSTEQCSAGLTCQDAKSTKVVEQHPNSGSSLGRIQFLIEPTLESNQSSKISSGTTVLPIHHLRERVERALRARFAHDEDIHKNDDTQEFLANNDLITNNTTTLIDLNQNGTANDLDSSSANYNGGFGIELNLGAAPRRKLCLPSATKRLTPPPFSTAGTLMLILMTQLVTISQFHQAC